MRRAAAYVAWPVLLGGSFVATLLVLRAGMHPVLGGTVVYLGMFAVVLLCERVMPHTPVWNGRDGQLWNDLTLTFVGSALPAELLRPVLVLGLAGAAGWVARHTGGGVWPHAWPLAAQVILAMFIADFGGYWAHRLAHEVPLLWRFHAVHHSAPRLYAINTGRFHPVDTLESHIMWFPLLILAGAPELVLYWLAMVYNYIGLLSHCNIAMHLGPLNFLFNTPGVHRWHHSRRPEEGNRNYGENVMLFDLLFGTFHCPADRRPPVNVGIDWPMPPGLWGQLLVPARWRQIEAAGGPSLVLPAAAVETEALRA